MSKLAVLVVDSDVLEALAHATPEALPAAVRTFRQCAVQIEQNASSAYSRGVCEAIFLAAVDVVDSQYETLATHTGYIPVCTVGHPSVLARGLMPLWNASHLGRLVREYAHDFTYLNPNHYPPARVA